MVTSRTYHLLFCVLGGAFRLWPVWPPLDGDRNRHCIVVLVGGPLLLRGSERTRAPLPSGGGDQFVCPDPGPGFRRGAAGRAAKYAPSPQGGNFASQFLFYFYSGRVSVAAARIARSVLAPPAMDLADHHRRASGHLRRLRTPPSARRPPPPLLLGRRLGGRPPPTRPPSF